MRKKLEGSPREREAAFIDVKGANPPLDPTALAMCTPVPCSETLAREPSVPIEHEVASTSNALPFGRSPSGKGAYHMPPDNAPTLIRLGPLLACRALTCVA